MKKVFNIINSVVLISLSYLAISTGAVAQQAEELCIDGITDCTFVLLSNMVSNKVSQKIIQKQNGQSSITEESEILMVVNKDRATQQYSPFSTFKIPNSLIGLDTKIIKNAKQPLIFDKEKYPVQRWWPSVWKLPEYNLSSAFKFSMVPIYRQLATDIGQQQMQSYVTRFAYGNQDISSRLDNFWLNGSMQISAVEQVYFLQKMNQGQLAVKAKSVELLKDVMLIEETDQYKLYAKTGAGKANPADKNNKAMFGWYVGFVENTQGVHYFAFNFTRDSYALMKAERVKIAMNHLKKAGII